MAHHATQHSNNGRDINNLKQVFHDHRLKPEDMGVLGFIIIHGDNHNITIKVLVRNMSAGTDKIAGCLHRLERHGYITHVRNRNSDGTLGTATYVANDTQNTTTARRKP